jgi:hypothetical protein
MFGWSGGAGSAVYGGGRRRLSVSANIRRTGASRTADTPRSPVGDAPAQFVDWSCDGSVRAPEFAAKQFREPAPDARARSARPLPATTLSATLFPRGRHRGPGSGAFWLNVTYRAVEKTAIP